MSNVYRALVPQLQVFNAPPIYAGDELLPCIYVAARTGASNMLTTPTVTLFLSRDLGVTYEQVLVFPAQATMGMLLARDGDPYTADGTIVAQGDANEAVTWMRNAALPVQWFSSYVPQSASEARVLDGENMILVGDEVFQFATVGVTYGTGLGSTDRSDNGVYHHTDLLRGRRGTEGDIANIEYGADVALVDENSLIALPLRYADIDRVLYFKAATPGLDLTDAVEHVVTFTGRSLRPFAPSLVYGVRDGSNDTTINWTRRTRFPVRLFGAKGRPLGEDQNNYVVEILSNAQPYTILRTIEVTAATSTIYTAAQAATDGLTAGAFINVRIYQMSDAVGRGLTGTWRIPANDGGAGTPTPNAKLTAERRD